MEFSMSSAPYLNSHNLSTSYGSTKLFENLSFTIHPGERWGIVGPNGAGKSTLFRLIDGSQSSDSGSISIRNGLRIAILSQKYNFDPEKTVEKILRDSLPIEYDSDYQAKIIENEIHEHSQLAEKKTEIVLNDKWIEKLTLLQDKLLNISGVGTENIIQSAMKAGNLTQIFKNKFSALSGGQQKRVQIITALLKNPQLILLDEPTNHLDVQTVDWLEELLLEVVEQGASLFGFKNKNETTEPIAFAIISHDRALLDTLVNKILEIEAGESKQYEGNYESYSQAKLEASIVEEKTKAKMSNLMRRELAWLRTGAKARTTKQKSRIDRALALDKKLIAKEQKASLAKNAEITFNAQMVDEQRNTDDSIMPVLRNLGEQELVNLKKVTIKHPKPESGENNLILQNLDLIIKPKMRIALLGPNGCGKSTLMNLIASKKQPSNGEIVYHDLVQISYFDQQRKALDYHATVRMNIAPEGEFVLFGGRHLHIMSYLDRFLFYKFDVNRKVSELSGGEQARLLLAKLMLEQSNLLILDEPTNDLDIPTLQVLERNITEFQGGVIFTSHDRYFVQRVATGLLTYIGEHQNENLNIGRWLLLPDLDQALNEMDKFKENDNSKKNLSKPIIETIQSKKKKINFKEQKEIESLETKIDVLENIISELTTKLNEAYSSGKIHANNLLLSKEINEKQIELEKCYKRWEELCSKDS
jgi:ABC transport system ATP-binding/permease protein